MFILGLLLFNNNDDKKVSSKNSSNYMTINAFDFTESNLPKERVKLGIQKQTLLRLEQSISEQRDL